MIIVASLSTGESKAVIPELFRDYQFVLCLQTQVEACARILEHKEVNRDLEGRLKIIDLLEGRNVGIVYPLVEEFVLNHDSRSHRDESESVEDGYDATCIGLRITISNDQLIRLYNGLYSSQLCNFVA